MNTNENKIFPDSIDGFFFRKAWEIFWEHREFLVKLLFSAALIFSVISELFYAGVTAKFEPAPVEEGMQDMRSMMVVMFFWLVAKIIIYIPETFLLIVFIKVLPKMYARESIDFSSSFSVKLPQWARLYIYSVFILLLEIVGLSMCIVPGIMVMIQFAFLPIVIALEEDVNVIPRSFHVISGRQWNVFTIYLAYFSLVFIYTFISMIIFNIGENGTGTDAMEYTLSISGFLGTFIQQLIVTAMNYFMLILFFQLYIISRVEKGEIEIIDEE